VRSGQHVLAKTTPDMVIKCDLNGKITLVAYTMCNLVTTYVIMNNLTELLFVRHTNEQRKTWKSSGPTVACQPPIILARNLQ
jgi:hypothetical protein